LIAAAWQNSALHFPMMSSSKIKGKPMTQTSNTSLDPALNEAASALDGFARGPAQDTADYIGEAFSKAGKRISSALGEAARSGEISVKGLAAAILRDLSNLAIERFVTGPINNVLGSILKSTPSFGARANGGPVTAGGAYLVGERGPELFTPTVGGSIGAASNGPPVTININMPAGSNLADAKRSSAQVSAALARAVYRGSGFL
jgi:phage-related minor tail protein